MKHLIKDPPTLYILTDRGRTGASGYYVRDQILQMVKTGLLQPERLGAERGSRWVSKDSTKSRRTHWRSNYELKRIHRNLPWNKNKHVRWGIVVLAFLGSAAVTQLVIWEVHKVKAYKLALSAIPQGKVWCSSREVNLRFSVLLHHLA